MRYAVFQMDHHRFIYSDGRETKMFSVHRMPIQLSIYFLAISLGIGTAVLNP
jgi:hypothetical protein